MTTRDDYWENVSHPYEDGDELFGTLDDYDAQDWQDAVDAAPLADLFDEYDEDEPW